MRFLPSLPLANILTLASILCVSGPAQSDIAITYSDPTDSSGQMVLTVAGNRAAMQVPGPKGGEGRIVYDHSSNKMYMVMDSEKQFIDIESMMESLSGLSSMLAGMMENMPEETKGQLGGILGNLGGSKQPTEAPQLVETGQSDSVMGISCKIATMASAGNSSEMCLANPSELGISKADFAILQGMMAQQQKSAKQMGEMLGMKSLELGPGALDRVPLRIKQTSGPEAGTSSEVIATSNEVNVEAVVIPDSYTPMDMNMLGG